MLATSTQIETVNQLMAQGIGDVQAAFVHPWLHALNRPATHETEWQMQQGVNSLTVMEEILGVEGPRTARFILETESFPCIPIVKSGLFSVAISPVLARSEREQLVDTWTHAASSGVNKTYPLHRLARRATISIFEDAEDLTGNPELRDVIMQLEETHASVKVLKCVKFVLNKGVINPLLKRC